MSSGDKLRHGVLADGKSRSEMDSAIRKIIERTRLVTHYDIPYLAGYSVDGRTVFIDSTAAKQGILEYKNELIMHECVEKAMMMFFGLPYAYAHIIATAAEKALVVARGMRWEVYDSIMQRYVQETEKEHYPNLPPDLDLTPYQPGSGKGSSGIGVADIMKGGSSI